MRRPRLGRGGPWGALVTGGLVALGSGRAAAQTPASGAPSGAPSDTAALRVALERVNAAELAAVVRGDARAAAAYYTADAVLLPPDGSVVRGRPAVEAFWAAGRGTTITDVETRTVAAGGAGEMAYLAGTYALTSRAGRGAPARVGGTFLLVFRREGDGWRIAQDIWTTRDRR